MSLRAFRLLAFVLSSLGLIILNACGGGGSSSSLPGGSFQLTVTTSSGGTVSSNPAGINCGQTCTAPFNSGTQVTLTATPAANESFTSWGGACSGTKPTCTLTLNSNQSASATFTAVQAPPTLTVTNAGTGTGTVTSAPKGINCPGTCSTSFPSGTQVTLTAAAASGSSFAGWSVSSCGMASTCAVTLTANQSVTATFNVVVQALPILTVSVSGGTGTGTVTSAPAGISCPGTCSSSFPAGTQVTLTAAAASGSGFAGWSLASCGTASTCVITLTANQSVVAIFNIGAALPVSVTGTGTGLVTSLPGGITCPGTCTANFAVGSQVILSASPAPTSLFNGWSVQSCGTALQCTVTVAATNPTITANFIEPTLGVTIAGPPNTNPGSVISTSPPPPAPQINCPTASCSGSFGIGTNVVLAASANPGFSFVNWSANGCGNSATCTVPILSSPLNQSVTANFTNSYVLTVIEGGTGTGTVTSAPTGINCGTACSYGFAAMSQVTLTETPNANNTFAGWSGGGCSGTNNTCTVTMSAAENVTANFTGPQNLNAINHIVFLAQENRSFDHYFGALRAYWAANGFPDQSFNGLPQFNPTSGPPPLYGPPPSIPGCDPAFPPPSSCVFDPKNPVTSYPLITECIENPSPSWDEAHADWNYNDEVGKYNDPLLNGFVKTAGGDARADGFYDVNGIRAMGYYDGTSLNYYYYMASNFGTSDNWFHPVMTRTHPNREYLVAATSQGYVYPIGTDSQDKNLLTATTIFQELQAAGISWKIYVDPTNSSCTGPPYDPNCLINLSYIQFFKWGHTIAADCPTCIAPISQYFTDLANGTLPQVAQIEPATDAGFDEHPSVSDSSANNIQYGQRFVSTLINGLMTSSSWKDSAFILTWDENGGLYDHVPPVPTVNPDGIPPVDMLPGDVCNEQGDSTDLLCDFKVTGYRIPLIVVSPYANKNYVSHTAADTTAILKMIETRFNLTNLTQRDAAQPDMTEFFNFTNPPWMTPPTPPTPNTNGACYLNKLP